MQFIENRFFSSSDSLLRGLSKDGHLLTSIAETAPSLRQDLFVFITTYSFAVWIFFFRLEEGKAYYIEALQKQKNDENHVEVAVLS